MKNILGSILVILIILVGIFIVGFVKYSQQDKEKLFTYYVEGKRVRLLMADDPLEWAQGLMHYRKLDNADGMIFLFPDKQIRDFWNKNTLMNLDIYWYADDNLVGKDFLPSIEQSRDIVTVNSVRPVNKVIELVRE